jgi:hypothetical protein
MYSVMSSWGWGVDQKGAFDSDPEVLDYLPD